jgi:outer membrane receptor for ferrienterochelin and colicins
MLKDIPGFDFTAGQPSGEFPTHFLFRGISDVGQTKVQIMVDGIVRNDVSNGWSRHIGYEFTLADVEKVKIVAGPGSALYGANAYVGVINVITRSGDAKELGLAIEARGTFGSDKTAAPEVFARYRFANGVDFQLAGRWYRSDGGVGREDPGNFFNNNFEPDSVLTTEYDDIVNERSADGGGKPLPDGFGTDLDNLFVRGRISKDRTLIGFTFWDQNDGLGSEVVAYEYFANTPGIDYKAHHSDYTVWVSYDFDFREGLYSRTRTYFRSNRILPETGFTYTYKYQSVDNGIDSAVPDKKKGYHGEGFIGGLEEQLNIDISERNHLVLGLQFEQEIKEYHGISLGPEQDASSSIVQSTYTSEVESVQPIFFSRNAAFYIQDEHRLGSVYALTTGLRFDADDEYGHAFNPRLALVRSPKKGLGFKWLYGEAFKAPTVFEWFDEFRGNEALNPEKIATTELKLNYRLSQSALLRGSFFYSRLNDLILVAPNPDPEKYPIGPNSEHLDFYQNIGSTQIRGITLTGDVQPSNALYGYFNYSCYAAPLYLVIDLVRRIQDIGVKQVIS